MKKKYATPELEVVKIILPTDVLGASTFVPEETLVEETIDIELE